MTTTPVPHTAAAPGFGQAAPAHPHEFAHPDATDRIVAGPKPTFGQTMGARSTEFKNALIAGGVGIAVAFLAAGFGLGYWAGDAGSSSTTPQSGFSQMGGNSQMGGGQMGGGQTGSGQTGGTQNGFPGGSFGGQSQDGTGSGTGTTPGSGTGTGTAPGAGTGTGSTTS